MSTFLLVLIKFRNYKHKRRDFFKHWLVVIQIKLTTHLRLRLQGTESSLDDCVLHLICPCCTLCQVISAEARNTNFNLFWPLVS
jgi:Cys-rich protein (TIGR01571 family)